jgi:hypothetical protein
MKWLAIVRNHEGTVVHCEPCKTGEDASVELARYRRETGYGFGTEFIIAEVYWAITE